MARNNRMLRDLGLQEDYIVIPDNDSILKQIVNIHIEKLKRFKQFAKALADRAKPASLHADRLVSIWKMDLLDRVQNFRQTETHLSHHCRGFFSRCVQSTVIWKEITVRIIEELENQRWLQLLVDNFENQQDRNLYLIEFVRVAFNDAFLHFLDNSYIPQVSMEFTRFIMDNYLSFDQGKRFEQQRDISKNNRVGGMAVPDPDAQTQQLCSVVCKILFPKFTQNKRRIDMARDDNGILAFLTNSGNHLPTLRMEINDTSSIMESLRDTPLYSSWKKVYTKDPQKSLSKMFKLLGDNTVLESCTWVNDSNLKNAGQGLFSRKALPPGTPIGLYSGEWSTAITGKSLHYVMRSGVRFLLYVLDFIIIISG